MKTEYKFRSTQPYSLHDMRINSMKIVDRDLHFAFESGFVRIAEPCRQVSGSMVIENPDTDFCTVFLLSKNGRSGRFQGKKLELEEFIGRHHSFSFEIVDEMYGYNRVCYGGFLSVPDADHLIEMQLMIYYDGSIIYNTEEETP